MAVTFIAWRRSAVGCGERGAVELGAAPCARAPPWARAKLQICGIWVCLSRGGGLGFGSLGVVTARQKGVELKLNPGSAERWEWRCTEMLFVGFTCSCLR